MGPTSFGGGLGYDEPPGRLKAALLQPQVERRMASTHGMNNTFATSKHMCIKCETKSSRQMMNVSSSTLCLGGGNSQIFFGIFTPNVWGFMIQFDGCIFFSTGFWNHQPDKQKKRKWWYDLTWNMGKVNLCRESMGTETHKQKKSKTYIPKMIFPFLPLMSRVRKESMRISERPRPHGVAWCQVENSWGSFFQHPKQEIYQLQNGNFQIWWYSNWWWYSSWFQLI